MPNKNNQYSNAQKKLKIPMNGKTKKKSKKKY